jgi:hypothetical protein
MICHSCRKEIPEQHAVHLGVDDGPLIHMAHYRNPKVLAVIDRIIEEQIARTKRGRNQACAESL